MSLVPEEGGTPFFIIKAFFFFFFFISPLKNSIKNNTNLQNSVPPKAGKDTESSSPHFEWHLQIFNHIVLKVQTSLAPNNAKTSSVSVLKTKKKKKISFFFFFFFFFFPARSIYDFVIWHQPSLKNIQS